MPRVACFGSLNLDLTLPVPRLPGVDETLAARGLQRFRGGKGHNQATAASRLATTGTAVAMVGAVGTDDAGDRLVEGLQAAIPDARLTGHPSERLPRRGVEHAACFQQFLDQHGAVKQAFLRQPERLKIAFGPRNGRGRARGG